MSQARLFKDEGGREGVTREKRRLAENSVFGVKFLLKAAFFGSEVFQGFEVSDSVEEKNTLRGKCNHKVRCARFLPRMKKAAERTKRHKISSGSGRKRGIELPSSLELK